MWAGAPETVQNLLVLPFARACHLDRRVAGFAARIGCTVATLVPLQWAPIFRKRVRRPALCFPPAVNYNED